MKATSIFFNAISALLPFSRMVFLLLIFLTLNRPLISAKVEIFFVKGIFGQLEEKDMRKLSFLQTWKNVKGKQRYIIDLGDNYLPGILGNFSSGLAIAEIMEKVGFDYSLLGINELQLNFEYLQRLQSKSGSPFLFANLENVFVRPKKTKFIRHVILGEPGNQVLFLVVYGKEFLQQINYRKWPILRSNQYLRFNLLQYLSEELKKYKTFTGAKILLVNGAQVDAETILQKNPGLDAVINFNTKAFDGDKSSHIIVRKYLNKKIAVLPLSWKQGFLFLNYDSLSSEALNFGWITPANLPPVRENEEISQVMQTWQELILNSENKHLAYLNRSVKKEENVAIFTRMMQDYFHVEWLILPKWYIYPVEMPEKLDSRFLDQALLSNEQFYTLSIRGHILNQLHTIWGDKSFYFWQNPGDDTISDNLSYRVALPSRLYQQAYLKGILPEETFKIKSWKGMQESIQGYIDNSDQEKPLLVVGDLLAPNPMWRWTWIVNTGISFKNISVNRNNELTRPDFVNSSSEAYGLDYTIGIQYYNINHSITAKQDLSYSEVAGDVIDNSNIFTLEYENKSFLLKPYVRTRLETLVVYDRVAEFYSNRPYLLSQAFGINISTWLLNHKIGLRMQKDINSAEKTNYGIEYILDFSKLFLEIFTYTIRNGNYVSYNEEDLQKVNLEFNLQNELKIKLIRNLNLVLNQSYKVYQIGSPNNNDKLENKNFKAQLEYEAYF